MRLLIGQLIKVTLGKVTTLVLRRVVCLAYLWTVVEPLLRLLMMVPTRVRVRCRAGMLEGQLVGGNAIEICG